MTILELIQQHAANPVIRDRAKPQIIEHTRGIRATIRAFGGFGWYTRGTNALADYETIIGDNLDTSSEWTLIGPVQSFAGRDGGDN